MASFLITCCNATCAIPEAQRELFKGSEDLVTSPEGWEPGSLNLAQGLAMKLSTPLIHGDVTRLLINLEEVGDKQWSRFSKKIPEGSRSRLGDRHNQKFKHAIKGRLEEDFKRNDLIIHLDIHTAPIAEGKILFEYTGDSSAKTFVEKVISSMPEKELDLEACSLTKPNGLTKWLLNEDHDGSLGIIRITVSQTFFLKSIPLRWETVKKSLIKSIASTTI
ncbi:MAG: hypothetical protein AB8D78_03175 [Akkermansiaceae bacterium]